MNTTKIICNNCKTECEKPTSEVSRAAKIGRNMFCSISCSAQYSAIKNNQKTRNIKIYNENPKQCKYCDTQIPYQKRMNVFCTQVCAAKYNNAFSEKNKVAHLEKEKKLAKCANCGKTCKYVDTKCCSQKCHREFQKKEMFALIENGNNTLYVKNYRKYLIEKRGPKCEQCGWDKINPKTGKCPIELDHIDGNHKNNSIENLRLLCPNCHSLTPTYKALNMGNGRKYRNNKQ